MINRVRQTDVRWQTAAVALIALLAALLVPMSSASAANGTITGTVTNAAGVPVQGIQISVETGALNADGTVVWTEHQAVRARTNASGSYSASVPPGTTYRVGFHGSGFVPEYFDDALTRETADNVAVPDGGTTPNINASLTASRGGVSGIVQNIAGEPIVNVPVSVLSLRQEGNGTRTWVPVATTSTGPQGTYLIRDLAPGTYRLGFVTNAFEPRYWPAANHVEEGDDIVIADGVTLANLNVVLVAPGIVKGRILNPDGTAYTGGGVIEALREIEVRVAPGQVRTFWEVAGSDSTLVDGNYDFSVPSDVYRIRFTLPDGSKGYLPDLSRLRGGDEYVVDSDATTRIPNLHLPEFGTLSGRVFDGDGDWLGANDAEIELYYEFVDQVENGVAIRSWEKVRSVATDASGRFSLRVLPRLYKVRINTPGLGRQYDEYYLDQPATPQGFDDATQVQVFSGSDTSLGSLFVGEEKAVVNDTVPWVAGGAKQGATLTAHLGTWTPFDADLSVQWLADGLPIAGATQRTYQIPALGGSGKRYSIRVVATKFGLAPGVATSMETGPAAGLLGGAAFENRARPTVSGSFATGSTLTATDGQWSVPPTSVSHQWLANGVPIPGATGSTYSPTATDLGKKIQVRVDATLGDQSAFGVSAVPRDAVVMGTVTNQALPSISGDPVVGETLTAAPGTWSPADAAIGYQWLADGAVIPGATTSSFAPGEAQIGRRISVRVTATKTGMHPGVAESAETEPVTPEPRVSNTEAPSISGAAQVGSVLTADEGEWEPAPTSYAYQWLAGDEAIAGATARTYTPKEGDIGKVLRVRVTARLAGIEDGVATSAPTAPVTKVSITVTAGPSIVGVPSYGRTLIADPGEYAPDDVQLLYQWVRNGKGIPGARSRTYQVKRADLGKRISVHVGYVRDGSEPVVRTSPQTAKATTKASLSIAKISVDRGVRLAVDVVAAGVNRVRGVVKAVEGGAVLKRARVRGSTGVLTIRNLAPGRHRIKVVLSGDPRVKQARRTVTVSVPR